jgi:glycine cleavage system aminomethyltransferase T
MNGNTLGLAKVPAELAKAVGTPVTATVGGKEIAGEIAPHPVYEKERRKAKEL